MMDDVSKEAPQWTKLVGDRPAMVCSREGFFGYWAWDAARPFEAWEFHPISEKVAPIPFGHGLGVGDIDGDGRADVISKDGWYQQPAVGTGLWEFHPVRFAPAG